MRVTTGQFGRLTAHVAALADEVCAGRVVAITEGGYDLQALATSLDAAIGVLAGEIALEDFPAPEGAAPRGGACIEAVTPHLREYWQI
jgi:acetoin utilization deacetylase AcuC-like enzyme